MALKPVLLAVAASLVTAIMLFLLLVAINRPVDEITLLLMVALVVGAGVFTGARTKRRQTS